jgi:hypothetical protein
MSPPVTSINLSVWNCVAEFALPEKAPVLSTPPSEKLILLTFAWPKKTLPAASRLIMVLAVFELVAASICEV